MAPGEPEVPGDTNVPGDPQSPLSTWLIGVGTAHAAGREITYQLWKVQAAEGPATFVEWLAPEGNTPRPAVLLPYAYAGIDWSDDPLDQPWADLPTGGYPDINGPDYQPSSGTIFFGPVAPPDVVANAHLYLAHNFGVLAVYDRFYLGGDVANDRQDMVNGYAFLVTQALVQAARIGTLGVSWGGFEALYGAAFAPAAVRPVVGVAISPVVDCADEYTWVHTDIQTGVLEPNQRAGYLAFFDPYIRRIVAATGGAPGVAGADYSLWTTDALVSRMTTSFLLIHDTWDLFIPVRQSQVLVTTAPNTFAGLWYDHATPVDLNSTPFSHGPLGPAGAYGSATTFAMAFLLTHLADTTQSVTLEYSAQVMTQWFDDLHARQLAGVNVDNVVPRLRELGDPRVTMLEIESLVEPQGGAGLVAAHLNRLWGTSLTASTLLAALATGLPPP